MLHTKKSASEAFTLKLAGAMTATITRGDIKMVTLLEDDVFTSFFRNRKCSHRVHICQNSRHPTALLGSTSCKCNSTPCKLHKTWASLEQNKS